MTKEEAIKILNGYMCGKIDPESTELYHAIELVVDILESQPSLPSNLDEAALKELQVYLPQGNGPDGICYFIAPQMLAMYKAGAEGMAGQGVSVDGLFGIRGIESNNIVDAMLGGGLKMGDKVIVQIRKK